MGNSADHKPAEHARAAAEAIRSLNHATLRAGVTTDPGGYEWPSDIYDAVVALQQLVMRLPQSLGQMDDWLSMRQIDGAVGTDHGQSVADTCAEARGELKAASAAADRLLVALMQAAAHTAHLTGETPGANR